MTEHRHYDVIIIGSGAGGGTLAYALAGSGKRILLLERGGYVPREKENWSSEAVNLAARYNTRETWRDKHERALHPHTNYNVGGNTKFYGAALFRLRREDFGELQHHGGVSPAWPIRYEDLEPYYGQAEQLYQVHGERGVDPTEPPSSTPYPFPPVSHEPRIAELHDHFAAQGLQPFHVPLGVMLDERAPQRSPCIRCSTCDGFPCLVQAKADAEVCAIRPALASGDVELVTGAHVTRLETSSSGREVRRVFVVRHGESLTFAADLVVLSAGAINSAALLLRSESAAHPHGLANASGVVGRHYMGHTNSVLIALSRCENPTVFQKTLALNDFYFGTPEWPYPMGTHLVRGQTRPARAAGWRAGGRPGLDARADGAPLAGFLAHFRGLARPGEPSDAEPRWPDRAQLHAEQPGRPRPPHEEAEVSDATADVPRPRGALPRGPIRAQFLRRRSHSARRRGPPERNRALRERPDELGVEQ